MPSSQLIKSSKIKVDYYREHGAHDFNWSTDFWDVRSSILSEPDLNIRVEDAKLFNELIYAPLVQYNPKIQHSGSIDIIPIRLANAAQAVDNYLASKHSFTYASVTFSWEQHFHSLQKDILSMEQGSYEKQRYLQEFNSLVGYRLLSHHPKVQHLLITEDDSCPTYKATT